MPGGALCSHLLLGCPPAMCELRVGTLLSIDPESGGLEGKMWRPEGNELDQAKNPRDGGRGPREA